MVAKKEQEHRLQKGEKVMEMLKTSDLSKLDVINMEEGRLLGHVCDVDLDPETGKINFLIVDYARPFFFFWSQRKADLEIPWRDVVVIGVDVILVKNRTWQA